MSKQAPGRYAPDNPRANALGTIAARGASASKDEKVITILSRRFEILKRLDPLPQGITYLARDARDNRLVRLKVFSDQGERDSWQFELFRLQAHAAARLAHRNIEWSGDIEQAAGIYFCVSEQEPYAKRLRDLLRRKGWLDSRQAIGIALQIASALEHAHSTYVLHLKLQPENILIAENGSVTVTDFGLEGRASLAWAHHARSCGVPARYLSIEQAVGTKVDSSSDMYALGIILFEMLTDRVLYDSSAEAMILSKRISQPAIAPHLLVPGVPENLSAITTRLLAENPAERFSATELIAALTDASEKDLRAQAEIAPTGQSSPGDGVQKLNAFMRLRRKLFGAGRRDQSRTSRSSRPTKQQ